MKRTINANGITIESESQSKFINANAAIMAAQMLQMNMVLQGYLVTSHMFTENKAIEVTVHFSDKPFPKALDGYKYTKKIITSHEYYSTYDKKSKRIRCVDYIFEW